MCVFLNRPKHWSCFHEIRSCTYDMENMHGSLGGNIHASLLPPKEQSYQPIGKGRERFVESAYHAGKRALITGSCGLIGTEVSLHLGRHDFRIFGIDNNERAVFFGPRGTHEGSLERLRSNLPEYTHFDIDIRDRAGILRLIAEVKPDVIVHTAAQPSHDRAASIPFDDFDTNAVGTLNLLEAAHRTCPESPFVNMSTNKVYGDLPNTIRLRELDTRWDYADPNYAARNPGDLFDRPNQTFPLWRLEGGRRYDGPGVRTLFRHADLLPARRCLTGPNHAGVELHGFLSYLVRCNLEEREYKVFGYKGKQVRDNIHSEDVANLILRILWGAAIRRSLQPGGGQDNSCSILEAFATVEAFTGKPQN